MSSPCHIELWLIEKETSPEAPKKEKTKGAGEKAKRTKTVATTAR